MYRAGTKREPKTMTFTEIQCECGVTIEREEAIVLPGREDTPLCFNCASYTIMMDAEDAWRDRQAVPAKPAARALHPVFAEIANGLFIRTAAPRKRRKF